MLWKKKGELSLEVLSLDLGSGRRNWVRPLFKYREPLRFTGRIATQVQLLVLMAKEYRSFRESWDCMSVFEWRGSLEEKVRLQPRSRRAGSSPVVHGELLIFSADGYSNPCLYALENTGEIRWKANRDSQAKKNFSFCTPW